uniref:YlcI/YnfO family protein n=1 Tax=Rosenbergiella nectarea TaxID=988801 RepID=UPI000B809514|nr:YlcI/YnfO family protein [Rosenbergiella nectarea]
MATGRTNNKSTQIASRVPHDVIDKMEEVKEESESTAQFIVAALRGEIQRRQRKLAKKSSEE